MKSRKLAVVAFLLVAVLTIGIGYAALTTHLNIRGAATVSVEGAQSAYADDIKFITASQAGPSDPAYTASIGDGKTADFSVTGLKGANESVTITYTIANSGDLASTVKLEVNYPTVSNDEYFSIAIGGGDYTTNGVALDAGDSITVTVTVTLLKTPTDTTKPTTCDFTVRLVSTTNN